MTAFHSVDQSPSSPDESPRTGVGAEPLSVPPVAPAEMDAEFYQAAVLHAGIPVVPLDVTGRIVGWNNAAVRMFGRCEADVLGRPLETLIPTEYRRTASQAFRRTLQQRSVNVYEIKLMPEGAKTPTHIGVTLSCVIDEANRLRGVFAWMRDITNRKELESHLDRTVHMASVGTLAEGIAHHFNNIAGGMGPMVEFALATEDRGVMLKALRMATEACARIRYITQSLLDCSQSPGIDGDVAAQTDLADLTEEVLRFADAVEPTLTQKGIALELDLQARRITAVPRIRFGQLLQHLLRNAEDAIAQRCSQVIGAEKRIALRTSSQGDQILLQFADTGCGIESEDLPRIFDPFFTKKGVCGGGNSGNPGLGLTLVHSVITSLNGNIWADSTPGQGTTINMMIPIDTFD